MTKYTFIAEHDDLYGKPSGHKVSTEFNADHISTVLENFQMFLNGVGFQTQGTLDFISDEESPEWQTPEWDTPQDLYDEMDLPQGKSTHYFETERNK